jgi:hypothetical protein
MRTCSCCGDEKPLDDFPQGNIYLTKSGEERRYRRKTCKECYAGKQRNVGRSKKRDQIARLIGWPAVAALVLVTGIYSHDYIKGRNRICFYDSLYGSHAITIDAMNMCPISMEFEI